MRGYIAVTEESLDRVAEATERPREFWEREMRQVEQYNCTLVVFPHEGVTKFLSIDNSYNIAFVMKIKFGLEPE